MNETKKIVVRGAAQHNLKHINLEIPRDQFIVVTGVSGSGKSSLAFDTLYAEGQRRYVESLSAYARQFLEQMQKPNVESIDGLPPTISIEQRTAGGNPRSTVATTTEIYDYLRLLFARVGKPHCHKCGRPITQQTPQRIVDAVMSFPSGTHLHVLGPLIRGQKGEHREVLAKARREGYVRVRVNGQIFPIEDAPSLERYKKHSIEAVVDRLEVKEAIRTRLQDSVETALKLGEGIVIISCAASGNKWEDHLFSELYACPRCGVSLEELSPRMFSFNSPYGACPTCNGLGSKMELDPDLIVPDPDRAIRDGAVQAWRVFGRGWNSWYSRRLRRFCRDFSVRRDRIWKRWPKALQRILLYGTNSRNAAKYEADWEGVIPHLEYRFQHTQSDYVKECIFRFMSELPCPDCNGARLRPESRSVTVAGQTISEITALSVARAGEFFQTIELSEEDRLIAAQVIKEIRQRLTFMQDVGLSYLTLDRASQTLAGGEAQRIRLATQVGSGLVGVCYVLDEPSIGLHQRDNRKLITTLRRLQQLGNTVIVVEHDEQTIRAADHVIDLGPGAGAHGGQVIAQGPVARIESSRKSITGAYLRHAREIPVPKERRPISPKNAIVLRGSRENNLQSIDVAFPLGGIVCTTGVSGSGKSTLIGETLVKALRRALYGSREKPGAFDRLVGAQKIDKVIEIDQSPIGRTSRSNPATYTKCFDEVRKLFALVRESKVRGYKPGRFSFNVKGGRCEACQGQGVKTIEMHFLPDIHVVCEECQGTRYNRDTLEIKYKGVSIAEVLEMTIERALTFFKNIPRIQRFIQTLYDVGLGYMALGQSSTTLSGGEAQRVKLAAELGKRATGNTLYVLDEPTTGLHFADIHKLLDVLNRLADLGNTIIIIEHNLDVIKCADYLIDLGPEGGDDGGRVVATGTPEEVAAVGTSYTGQYLRPLLGIKKPARPRKRRPRKAGVP